MKPLDTLPLITEAGHGDMSIEQVPGGKYVPGHKMCCCVAVFRRGRGAGHRLPSLSL